jgi:glycosyltransferase involved in cell wall biosynthesis
MRILFIHNHYQQPGGEDRAVELESKLLQEKGHPVKVLFFENRGITDSLIQKAMTLKNAIHNSRSAALLRRVIQEFSPDIIHVHNLFFTASPAVLKEAYRQGIPIILTLHNYRTICCNALLLRENKPCEICIKKKLPLAGIRYACYRESRLASALVTFSTGLPKIRNNWQRWVDQYIVLTAFAEKKFMHSSLGVRPEQLKIKPNFVPDTGIGDAGREPYFLFVGRLSPEKGVQVLLEAFRNMPDKEIRIAGDGPDKEAFMLEYKNSANIRFLGNCSQTDVLKLMKKTTALIFPSVWYEGLPFVILEAFSTGTPVIASDLGAMSSLIQDHYNGLVFKAGSAEELKSAVLRFRPNDEKIYRQARDTYLNYFNPDIHYQSVMKIYDQSIQAAKERRGA